MTKLENYQQVILRAAFEALVAKEAREIQRYEEVEKEHWWQMQDEEMEQQNGS